MVIKVYVSNVSGNMEIKKQQKRIIEILQGKRIEYEEIDISDPTMEEEKKFMRAHSQPREGQVNPLPPQIFSEQDYCGDYDLFQDAAEFEELFEFLKLAPQKTVSTAAVTITEAQPQEDQPDYGRNEEEEEQQRNEEEEKNDEEEKEEEYEEKKDDYEEEQQAEAINYSQVSSSKTETETETRSAEDEQGGYTITTTSTSVTRTTRVGEEDDDDEIDRDDEASSSTHDYENVVISRDCDNNTVVQVKEDEAPDEENFPSENAEQPNGNADGLDDDEVKRDDDDDEEEK